MYANKNRLHVKKFETLTSGSVDVNQVQFEFSKDWDGMTRTAVFKQGNASVSVLLGEDAICTIPHEVLQEHGRALYAGVYGTKDGVVVLPTIWASLGEVKEGVTVGESARPPTPGLYEQVLDELSGKADGLAYTEDGELGLYAGEKLLSTVPVNGGGEEGTTDHRDLTNRDAEEQHPISSITGLSQRLDKTLTNSDFLTVAEILKIMEE